VYCPGRSTQDAQPNLAGTGHARHDELDGAAIALSNPKMHQLIDGRKVMTHRADGKVDRLYVDEGHCYIRLKGVAITKDSLFELRQSHQNYNALYALALAAAVNGYTLEIRTIGEIEDAGDNYPGVLYLVVDW
jgi:hypothetical protein